MVFSIEIRYEPISQERNRCCPAVMVRVQEVMAVSTQALHSRVSIDTPSAEERVELLVREHSGLVFRVAYSVLRDHHDAEDATQETFLRVLRHRSDLTSIREPRAWLARIAFRIALNRYKARKGELEDPTEVLAQLEATHVSVDEIVHRREIAALMEKLIAGLPAELRDVLRLSTVEELTSNEIGMILEIPENSVRTRLHRARQLLKQKIGTRLGMSHG
jgi:RNA polymerase sigma-70 factor, ECF subfamily